VLKPTWGMTRVGYNSGGQLGLACTRDSGTFYHFRNGKRDEDQSGPREAWLSLPGISKKEVLMFGHVRRQWSTTKRHHRKMPDWLLEDQFRGLAIFQVLALAVHRYCYRHLQVWSDKIICWAGHLAGRGVSSVPDCHWGKKVRFLYENKCDSEYPWSLSSEPVNHYRRSREYVLILTFNFDSLWHITNTRDVWRGSSSVASYDLCLSEWSRRHVSIFDPLKSYLKYSV